MSLHVILDGYNVLLRWGGFREKMQEGGIEDGRRRLVQFLEVQRPQGSLRNRVTVVFDGRSQVVGNWRQPQSRMVRVLFSQDEPADEQIVRMVGQEEAPSQVVVVTDDRPLAARVRQFGAKIVSVREFMQKKRQAMKSNPVVSEDYGGLDSAEARKITEELAKRWLVQ